MESLTSFYERMNAAAFAYSVEEKKNRRLWLASGQMLVSAFLSVMFAIIFACVGLWMAVKWLFTPRHSSVLK